VTTPTRDFSGRDVVKVLESFGYERDRWRESHVVLKYRNPDTGEIQTVTVPLHDPIKIATLQSIAEQCGADDFDDWCRWIDEHR